MAWFKVDDKLHSAPKLLSIPRKYRLAALGLWTIAGSWSADQLTDGVVPDYMIEEWGGTKTLVGWLVKADLWQEVEDKTQFKNWADYQPTRADKEEERAKNREKLRKWRERNPGGNEGVTGLQEGSNLSGNPAPVPSRPVPSLRTTTPTPDGAAEFDEWYAIYPRKTDKGHARNAFKTARKKTGQDVLMAAVRRFAHESKGVEQKFLAYPATWLNGERWEDEAPEQTVIAGPWSKDFHRNGTQA